MLKKLNFLLVGVCLLATVLTYSSLPQVLPMHWNIYGQVDNWSPKIWSAWFIPLLSLAILVLFSFLPKLDPKKDKYKLFEKEWLIIQTSIIAFLTYLQFVIFYLSLNPSLQIEPFMFSGLGVLFIIIGNFLSKIRQNYFIGIKLPWTLSSEENWNKTHRFASWCFVIAGLITLVEAFLLFQTPVIVLGSLVLAAVLPMFYSLLLYYQSKK